MTLQQHLTRRRGPATLVLGLVLVLALGVAACGGVTGSGEGVVSLQDPSASPDASESPSPSLDPEEAMLAFEACMKEHGVDIQVAIAGDGSGGELGSVNVTGPDKGTPVQPGSGGRTPEDLQAADEACRHLLPAAGRMDPDATIPPEQVDAMLAFATCMRDHGIDFPDPVFDGGGMTVQVGGDEGAGGIDPMSETFQEAQEACAAEMPDDAPLVIGRPAIEVAP
jgi:hypothetical protein